MAATTSRPHGATSSGAPPLDPGWIARLAPEYLLLVNVVELVLLVVLFVGWQWDWRWLSHDRFPSVIGGVFPIVVPWAAAMGGLFMSVKALVSHWDLSNSPDPADRFQQRLKWNVWTLMRMPVGVIIGTVGALIAVAFAGLVATDNGGVDVSPQGILTIGLVAFVLGYQQDAFDTLVTRVVSLLTNRDRAWRGEDQPDGSGGSGGSGGGGGTTSFLTAPMDPWRAKVGEVGDGAVTLTNPLDQDVDLPSSAIALSGQDAAAFQLEDPPTAVPAGAQVELELSFHPTKEGRHTATLQVTLEDQSATLALTGWGNAH